MKRKTNAIRTETAKKLPAHIIAYYGSARKFKSVKRQQFREAYRALGKLQMGCAFLPCGPEPISRAMKALDEAYAVVCTSAWGR